MMGARQLAVSQAVELVSRALAAGATPETPHLLAARSIVDAELRGRSEFGFVMLRAMLDEDPWRVGGKRPLTLRDRPTRLEMDASRCYASVALGYAAVEVAARASTHGIATVLLHAPRAIGQLAEYVRYVAEQGCVALLAVAAPPQVVPHGGNGPALGTNPFAFGIPASGAPMVIDAVTAAITQAALGTHRAQGLALPQDVALDSEGRPTQNAEDAVAVLPRDNSLLATLNAIGVEALASQAAGLLGSSRDRRAATLIALETDATIPGAVSATQAGDDLRERLRASGARVPGEGAPICASTSTHTSLTEQAHLLVPGWLLQAANRSTRP